MAGTIGGGKKTAQKNLERDPDFYKKIGARGGRNGTGHEFGHGKVDPVKAGRKGGLVRGENYKRAAESFISEYQIPKENSKKLFRLWNR